MRQTTVRRVLGWISIILLGLGLLFGMRGDIAPGWGLFALGCFLLTLAQYDGRPYLKGKF
ncbi:MAG: hypothetical protein R3272_05975 [Candidatus Promineifilaceae bacterium]|nr:hypothetical protein [Candidatus Promineifilaceae bacterium]